MSLPVGLFSIPLFMLVIYWVMRAFIEAGDAFHSNTPPWMKAWRSLLGFGALVLFFSLCLPWMDALVKDGEVMQIAARLGLPPLFLISVCGLIAMLAGLMRELVAFMKERHEEIQFMRQSS